MNRRIYDIPGEPVGEPAPDPTGKPFRKLIEWLRNHLPANFPTRMAGNLPHFQIPINTRKLGFALGILLTIGLIVLRLTVLRPVSAARAPTPTPAATETAPAVVAEPPTPIPPLTNTPTLAVVQPVNEETPLPAAEVPSALSQGLLVLSFSENTYAHLFAYQPQSLPLTRLTGSPWDDITPVFSPDGSRVAFASRQNGYWDVFILSLVDGRLQRVTDSGDADRSPTWSPDGKWLAFETYALNHAQIAVLSVEDPSATPMFLTSDENENHQPAWSPQGRKIAFISTRAEGDSLWLADLDHADSRFTRLAQAHNSRLMHPAWSPDGARLAWGEVGNGQATIVTWNTNTPDAAPAALGNGDWPVWSPDGSLIAARIPTPNQDFLAAYQVQTGKLVLPPQPLPSRLLGLDWKKSVYPASHPEALAITAQETPTPLWQDQTAPISVGQDTRYGLVLLDGVSAPNASLSDRVDESFRAMRGRLADELGWDFLSTLENAYLPITSPLPPESDGDWLYTGRAFSVAPAPLAAGWLVVAREDFGGQTFWRMYVKTRFQDGSQGQPLDELPWDISARYGNDPRLYEQGGAPAKSIPTGYWLDFTDFASRFGWERLPASTNWRAFYPGMRFNQLARTDGLTWSSAMLELYPPEALVTPPPSHAPKASPSPAKTQAPAQPSQTPTRRPTWTPLPG